jgi:kanamycin kinase
MLRAAIPDALRDAYASWQWTHVYENENGTVTYRLTSPTGDLRFLKLSPPGAYPSLLDEPPRLAWARAHLPVPPLIDIGSTTDGTAWYVTAALRGLDAMREPLISNPTRIVPILARGLRRFHATPIVDCPFSFRLDTAISLARHRVESNRIMPARHFHPEHAHLTAPDALALLERTRPTTEDLVLCHGDYCFPNALITEDEVSAYLDLGRLGIADRWWDLAIASWSTTWNVGPGHEALFLTTYGIAPDPARIAFYRLLYDLVA